MATWDDAVRLGGKLPEVCISTSYGTPALKVRGKLLVRMKEDDDTLVVRTADLDSKEALLAMDPRVFFTTDHYDGYAWVLVRLARVRGTVLEELLRDAYVAVAPKKLAASITTERAPMRAKR